MKPTLTDTLCTRCGLCCDGSLFADVELGSNDEAWALEVMGLEMEEDEDDSALLLQPCGALKGRRCSSYQHRPDCCRSFECGLLQAAKRGVLTVDQARKKIVETQQQIARVEVLIGELGRTQECLPLKERWAEVLASAEAGAVEPERSRKRHQLRASMARLERLIEVTFLGG